MADSERIIVQATSSRLSKGLLAIPQRFKSLFPSTTCRINVRFDNQTETTPLTYKPDDSRTKEARLYGLASWFSGARIGDGDRICIILEDRKRWRYRIALQQVIYREDESRARYGLETAITDDVATVEFRRLAELTRKRARQLAIEELERIAGATVCNPRPRALANTSTRNEGVMAGLRLLLRELHQGKCQLCSFTFQKRDQEPYFEIHHIDPELGHHPHNLLVLCANCHAQFEHALITDCLWARNWLISVRINGRRYRVRQPFVTRDDRRQIMAFSIVVIAQMASALMTTCPTTFASVT